MTVTTICPDCGRWHDQSFACPEPVKTYLRVTAAEQRWLRFHWRLLVNTGGNSLEHVLDLLNDFRRDNNNDLSVNLPRYLLGYGIECQLGVLRRLRDLPDDDVLDIVRSQGVEHG